MTEEKIAIIGTGKVGRAFAKALCNTGLRVAAVYDHHIEKANQCALFCENKTKYLPLENFPGDLRYLFLSVPDDRISSVAHEVAEKVPISSQTIVAHFSGALGSDALSPLAIKTKHLVSFHPAQTFPGLEQDWQRFSGIYFGIEGDSYSMDKLTRIVNIFKSRFVIIPADKKGLYHLGCVIASNYFVSLINGALQVMASVGFSEQESIEILQPLINSTFNNIKDKGPALAATGPIPRGDAGTVKMHLENLEKYNPELIPFYIELGNRLIKTVYGMPDSDKQKLDRIKDMLMTKKQVSGREDE
ncbi:DUF2520 domain-containing protein [candidate division KSB1 bacterium]|nr:DUF2520 domain-containing protein [candidate division KSB1 bacterium]